MTNEKAGDDVSKRNFYMYLSFIILGGISFLLLIIAFSLFLRKKLLLRARRKSRREKERQRKNSKKNNPVKVKTPSNEKIIFEGQSNYEKIISVTPVDITTNRKIDDTNGATILEPKIELDIS